MKDTNYTINCKGKLINFNQPKVMGIINITPDSFYENSRNQSDKDILYAVEKHLLEGANFIDIGGYSSRPNASHILVEEELKRIEHALTLILKHFPETLVSVDTFRSEVAKSSIQLGACMINDISAGDMDNKMFDVISQHHVPYIIMHMQGTPQTMQEHPQYNNVSIEVIQYLSKKIEILHKKGVNDIIIDPGFGFGKTTEHNFELLKNLKLFEVLNAPILAGLSRKSMIWKTLNTSPEIALNGTTSLNTIALLNGAKILRVHDVKEAKECIQLVKNVI